MLRFAIASTLIACLAACSVVPQGAWTFDPTHPKPRPAADAAQAAQLTNRIADLQSQLNAVRAQIAEQPDTVHRFPLYGEVDRIGRELSPLQRELGRYAQAR